MSTIILSAAVVLVIVWNLVPSAREKMRGWSTIIEGLMATVFTYFGNFAEAIREAQQFGYLPDNVNVERAVPFILFTWLVLKRFQTKTPVGKK